MPSLLSDKPEKIFDDWEIMTWGNELTKAREKGGCGILVSSIFKFNDIKMV